MNNNQQWQPSHGILYNTEIMEDIVKNINENILVIAGPGSGKTEILAQKANYLFEMNKCRYPYKILCISYKIDSALTIKKRVLDRCGVIVKDRFISQTIDAFIKSIVTRFCYFLPEWVEKLPINITMVNDDTTLPPSIDNNTNENMQESINSYLRNNKIPWNLMKLFCKYILQNNKEILYILQNTYSFVFIDEFQDTTIEQYDIIKCIFQNTKTKCMAVGDNNQAIMIFAGADRKIFEKYEEDFSAKIYQLRDNHRSNHEIIKFIQIVHNLLKNTNINNVSEIIDLKNVTSIKQNGNYNSKEEEYDAIAKYISIEIMQNKLKQHDFLIITRRKLDDKEFNTMANIFNQYDLVLNNDLIKINYYTLNKLRDFTLSKMLVHFIAYKCRCITYDSFNELIQQVALYLDYDITEERYYNQVISMLNSFPVDNNNILLCVDSLLDCIKKDNIINKDFNIGTDSVYDYVISDLKQYITELYKLHNSWEKVIELFYGLNQIQTMTIHKSKGMEYDTVFIVDCIDSIYFSNDINKDELKVFFVAISRAKNNLIITKNKDQAYPKFIEKILQQLPLFIV